MNGIPNSPQPLWRDTTIDSFPQLDRDMETDVTVIGSGITGITTAYFLVKKGFKVVLLEAGKVINGTTGYTTAKLSAQHGLIYDHLIRTFGKETAKKYYLANQEGLHYIDDIRTDLKIDCDFSYQPSIVYSAAPSGNRKIEKEAEAYKDLGIDGGLADNSVLPFPIQSAVKMNQQAQFHPLKYLKSLLIYLKQKDTHIFENTRAVDIKKGTLPEVKTRKGHSVLSDHVVIASHFPFKDLNGMYFARLHVERSYTIAVKTNGPPPKGMYLSTEEPKKSLRHALGSNGEELLLIGGEGHTSGQSENTYNHYEKLKEFAEKNFSVKDIPYRWSSQDISTLDRIPYIGPITRNNPNIYVATGFAKWGMSNGTVAGKVISDLITGNGSPYEKLFSPSRFNASQDVKNFTKENMDVAKELFKGKLHRKETDMENLQPNEGGIVNYRGKKLGAYKASNGGVSLVDTTCTHMGCDLQWNTAECSWDCPCHGSRFTPSGEVIEGPATKPLKNYHN
ncbi:FAD-dependent oxidoreductase [Thalassobacillus pellis]|uniref:FAD-dependent oxidoreductase n=1 Tax=Thalassobacillus pellis TaxID=748008 RepID=UPI001EF946E5|nr:FAD-dependent oxidoreductase [Thalassobacillus pellis]MBM7552571.1 glycine/D-amino acid oxidase-like deaminating enzyme/nitrite reductase/ring-hydroxylating ferredoxin subunit [Thalassobacillus pellis]